MIKTVGLRVNAHILEKNHSYRNFNKKDVKKVKSDKKAYVENLAEEAEQAASRQDL